jgi:Fe-coproporphyrin III synthase
MKYNDVLTLFNKYYSLIPRKFFPSYSFLPRQFIFEITYHCNLRCSICQFLPILDKSGKNSKKELTKEEIIICLKKLPSLSLVSFTGGEPLLRADIREILSESSKIKKIHLISNGYLLDYKTSEFLCEIVPRHGFLSKGLLGVDISYYGKLVNGKISENQSSEGLDNILRVKKEKGLRYPLVNFKIVITESNIEMIVPFFEFAQKKGTDVCSFLLKTTSSNFDRTNMIDELRDVITLNEPKPLKLDEVGKKMFKDQILKLTTDFKDSRTQLRFSPSVPFEEFKSLNLGYANYDNLCCYAPWSFAAISAFGDLFPCSNLNLGNLLENSLEDLWYSDKMREFRRMIKGRLLPNCRRCCYLQKI